MILPIIRLNPRSRYWLSSQAQGQRESNELQILPIHIQWSDQQYIQFFFSSKLIKKYVYDSKIKTRLMWWYQHCSYSQPLETIVVNQRGLFGPTPRPSMFKVYNPPPPHIHTHFVSLEKNSAGYMCASRGKFSGTDLLCSIVFYSSIQII